MSSFRIRHGQPEFTLFGVVPPGPILVIASNYSTRANNRYYPPTVAGGVARYSNRAYRLAGATLHRLVPKDRTITGRQRKIAARKARKVAV